MKRQGNGSFHSRGAIIGVCLALAAIIWIVFGQTLHHGFVNYDDNTRVYQNPVILRGFTLEGIASVFSFKRSVADYWHPLTFVTHMLDCQLYGLNAGGHHLTNVLLHTSAAVLAFLILLQMTGAFWQSAFVAAVFAIHPLRVESVAWISERKDVLSGVFFLLTIGAYLRYGRAQWSLRRYLIVVALFALGLMSKPTLMPLPFLLLVLDYWPLERIGKLAQRSCNQGPPIMLGLPVTLRVIIEKLPLIALSVGSCIQAALGNSVAFRSGLEIPRTLQIENALVSYAVYIWQTIWPVSLAIFYPFPRLGLPVWQVLLAVAVLAGISVGAFVSRKRNPWLLVGWLWYLGMLVPVIGFVQAGSQAHADRYTYLPQIGLILAATWALTNASALGPWRRKIFGVAGLLIIGLLIWCARIQTSYWRDNESLWEHALAVTADNDLVEDQLGSAQMKKERVDEAMAHFERALQMNPNYVTAHANLAIALAKKQQWDEAMAHFQRALEIDPNYSEGQYNFGNALIQMGRVDAALLHFQKAVEIQPDYAEARDNLGSVLLQKGQVDEAIAQYQRALEIKPDSPGANSNLGLAYAQRGDYDKAIEASTRALELAQKAGDKNLRAEIERRLNLYRNHEPYRPPDN